MTSLNKSVYDALINTSLNDVFQAAKDLALAIIQELTPEIVATF